MALPGVIIQFWLVVSTHLKHIRQIGSLFPQGSGWKYKNVWNHRLVYSILFIGAPCPSIYNDPWGQTLNLVPHEVPGLVDFFVRRSSLKLVYRSQVAWVFLKTCIYTRVSMEVSNDR